MGGCLLDSLPDATLKLFKPVLRQKRNSTQSSSYNDWSHKPKNRFPDTNNNILTDFKTHKMNLYTKIIVCSNILWQKQYCVSTPHFLQLLPWVSPSPHSLCSHWLQFDPTLIASRLTNIQIFSKQEIHNQSTSCSDQV